MSELTLAALSAPADSSSMLLPTRSACTNIGISDQALAQRAYCRAVEYLGHTVAPDIADDAGRRARRLVLAGIPFCGAIPAAIRYAQARQHARRWLADTADHTTVVRT